MIDTHHDEEIDPLRATAMAFAGNTQLEALFTDVAKKAETQGWLQGVIYATSLIFRSHGCSVSAKEALETLGNELETACRVSCEFDVAPLRQVIPDLPFGVDADYHQIEVICIDDGDKKCDPEDVYCYAVEAAGPEGNCIITRFDTQEEAEKFISANM